MKVLINLLFLFMISFSIYGQENFEKSKAIASQNHLLILLNFSGSDWCGQCIRMRNEIFSTPQFLSMADAGFIFITADFPRNKKNKLSIELQKQNNQLADKYNPDGKFPFTVLLNAEGKVIKFWDGLPKENITQFLQEIKACCDANK